MGVISISHRIELCANNKFKTYCRQAFGVARLSYNWAIARLKQAIDKKEKIDFYAFKKEFNALKATEFPFVYDVTKYACQQPFLFAKRAFDSWSKTRKKGKKVGFPKFKKKSYTTGSFYLGGDAVEIRRNQSNSKKITSEQTSNHQYLKVPNFGWVKMREDLRFEGHINSCTISQEGDKFYASFSMQITEAEYERTHKKPEQYETAGGFDLGIKHAVTTSEEIQVDSPKPLGKILKRLKREQRKLSRRVHPKAKGDKTACSKRYLKQQKRVNRIYRKSRCCRKDFIEKLTTVLIRHFEYVTVEHLIVRGMMANHKLARALSDIGFYAIRSRLETKAAQLRRMVVLADTFYPSSKTCSRCGHVKKELSLGERTYKCEECGLVMDRDVNAAMNLKKLATEALGGVTTEVKPVDRTALLADLAINQLTTSRVEAGTR